MSRAVKIFRNRNYVWPTGEQPTSPTTLMQTIDAANSRDVELLRGARVASTFERFLKEGRHGVFAMHDGLPVGHAWITRPLQSRQVVNMYARLAPGESLIHYCFVSPSFRGRGLYGEMLHHVTAWALKEGATRVRVDTSASNTPSQHGIMRAGFEETLPTTSVVLGRWLLGSWERPPYTVANA